jgi:hypothetical protein
VVAATGVGVHALLGEEAPVGGVNAGPQKPKVKTGPPSASEVKKTATAFLDAWGAGHTRQAAALTDDVQSAQAALGGFREKAHV